MDEEAYGITTEIREVSPAHYVFKIESFSLLSKNNIDVYETNEFEAGDEKWRLILYPKGDKSRNGGDHLSIYLAISKSTPLKVGSEINATVRFFVLDRIRDQYLTKQGRATRFHEMQFQWGIPRFMPLATFTDPSNGYLIDDTCVFGVEIVVIKNLGLGECFTPIEGTSYTHEWKISKFSTLVDEYCYSESFLAEDQKWKVRLYPRGDLTERDKSLSIYLCLADSGKLDLGQKVNASFTIRLRGKDGTVL
ncbi:MATH domain and coiled-coil domain-containing protein At1g31390-like [Syzygium oleosum]|uniref:MATH domain and coiled-coil domain-containing protein At1g31390-like n=1 Tax=Syzygium oleosum TaxID=219896 RepID=UPI0024BB4201|nr:MATH domain and coiled-coil domain-containing protein At1g31390-like [Syzygium oleosum]